MTSIIVLQHNHSERTLECLESLRGIDANIIVVDNGSEQKHIDAIASWKPILNKTNLGYGGGNNVGIKTALEHGADEVLILNNDVIVPPTLLSDLHKGSGDIIGARERVSMGHTYLSGYLLLINRAVFEKIGFFDERYFLYLEDVDFCVRAQMAGFRLGRASVRADHAVSGSSKSLGDATVRYYYTRNKLLFTSVHGNRAKLWMMMAGMSCEGIVQLIRNRPMAMAILQGVRDFSNNTFGIRS